jgi:hypothetical protein
MPSVAAGLRPQVLTLGLAILFAFALFPLFFVSGHTSLRAASALFIDHQRHISRFTPQDSVALAGTNQRALSRKIWAMMRIDLSTMVTPDHPRKVRLSQQSDMAKPSGVSTTFTVTTTVDNGNNASPTAGSLRKAIIDANNNSGLDTITFNITGAGVRTISPPTPLPNIISPVILNGATQPGFSGSPLIELNGMNAGDIGNGLILAFGSSGSTVKGFVINRFSQYGIIIDSSSNLIQGNYVGTDATGNIASGNGAGGVGLFEGASNNTIGGTTLGVRNIISGNLANGIAIADTDATNNVVQGNYIG